MKRVLLNNVWIKFDTKYLIMNLISFRREFITQTEFLLLQNIAHKIDINLCLSTKEQGFYQQMLDKKQILSDNVKQSADAIMKENIVVSNDNNILFNLSYKCNLNCKYCYQRTFNKNITLYKDDVDRIFTLIKHRSIDKETKSVCNEVIISGGEPLLEANLESINRIFELFTDSQFTLYTNGININNFIDKLDFTKFKRIQISIDGLDDIIASVNSWEEPIPLIVNLTDSLIKLSELGIEINVVTMLTKETMSGYNAFLKFAYANRLLKYPKLYFNLLFPVDYSNKNTIDESLFSLEEYMYLYPKLKQSLQKYGNNHIQLSTIPELTFLSNLVYRADKKIQKTSKCNLQKGNGFVVSPDGKIYWCTCVEENKYPIGEFRPRLLLFEDRIKEIRERNIFTIEECKTCDFKYVCGGGCPLYNIKTDSDIKNPFCGVFKNEFVLDNLESFI